MDRDDDLKDDGGMIGSESEEPGPGRDTSLTDPDPVAASTDQPRGTVAMSEGDPMATRLGSHIEGAGAIGYDVAAAEGGTHEQAGEVVDAAIDRWVYYAGWTDKIAGVLGSVNPVAGPLLSWSAPEPTGVVGVLAPQSSALLGLVDVLAPVLATGCTAVVVAAEARPLPAIALAEALATSDVPAGVANVLTGRATELGPWLAAHADVQALDLVGAPAELAAELERSAAGTVKRVLPRPATEPDPRPVPGLTRLRTYTEIKTVWHPAGR